jgi:ribosomal protein S18 acetylase RimI-like enzyme
VQGLTTRTVEASDASLVREIYLRTYEDSSWAFGERIESVKAKPEEYWIDFAQRLGGKTEAIGFIEYDQSKPIGLVFSDTKVWVFDIPPNTAVVRHLWVDSRYRGRGKARSLMEQVTVWAKSRDLQHLILGVQDRNLGAIEFYKRLGFSAVDHRSPWPSEPERTVTLFSRSIG